MINLRKTRCLYLNADADTDGDANADADMSMSRFLNGLCICMLIVLLVFTWKSLHHSVFSHFSNLQCYWNWINPFPANVPFLGKPGSWFLLAKVVKKHQLKSDILSEDAVQWPASLLRMSLLHRCFFTHFASTNQLSAFSIRGTLAGNGLNKKHSVFWKADK